MINYINHNNNITLQNICNLNSNITNDTNNINNNENLTSNNNFNSNNNISSLDAINDERNNQINKNINNQVNLNNENIVSDASDILENINNNINNINTVNNNENNNINNINTVNNDMNNDINTSNASNNNKINSNNNANNLNNNSSNLHSTNHFDDNNIILEPRIAVIGVGGGGCNAINTMKKELDSLSGVICISANTDSQVLRYSNSEIIIQLGPNCTRGLGAGANPEVGKQAASESENEIRKVLHKIDMVFIAAGMGGGTGTGAAPLIAKIAKEMGILTVAVVTMPFSFEGARRAKVASKGAEELMQTADSVVIVPNDKLLNIINDRTPLSDAFKMADDVLCNGVKCIVELIMKPGLINLDFADIRTIMSNMQTAFLSIGRASGEDRANQAAEIAINNPLSNVSLKGAESLLINISGGSNLTLHEINTAVAKILAERGDHDLDANILVGATYNEKLENDMLVYIIATGINDDSKKQINQQKNNNNSINSFFESDNLANIKNNTVNSNTNISANNINTEKDIFNNNLNAKKNNIFHEKKLDKNNSYSNNDKDNNSNLDQILNTRSSFISQKNNITDRYNNQETNNYSENSYNKEDNFKYENNLNKFNQVEERPSFFKFRNNNNNNKIN
ncbi:MAG: cell division protein FtsZ [Rickettsiales bacterium]